MNKSLFGLIFLVGLAGFAPVHACGTHGTNAGNTLITWQGETADSRVGHITITDNLLVPPAERTICVCGIGLGSAENPLPSGVEVTGVAIVITNADSGRFEAFRPFAFAPSANMTAGLVRVAGATSAAGDGPLFGGSRWFGFASAVAPFALPQLGPGQDIAFRYEIRVPKDTLPFTADVQFAAGEGLADERPDFTGSHPVTFFAAANRSVVLRAPVRAEAAPVRARPAPASPPARQPSRVERR